MENIVFMSICYKIYTRKPCLKFKFVPDDLAYQPFVVIEQKARKVYRKWDEKK